MTTKKIILNELRSLVKQIIKEEIRDKEIGINGLPKVYYGSDTYAYYDKETNTFYNASGQELKKRDNWRKEKSDLGNVGVEEATDYMKRRKSQDDYVVSKKDKPAKSYNPTPSGKTGYTIIKEIIQKILQEKEQLNEYSTKIINQLIDKFKQEQPNLDANIIKAYIVRFTQIKNSPKVSEKDIRKYNWKELETVVDSNQPKRIKAGKINDGEPIKDVNLVYNQNGLRIYVGKTKQACIKYGNGYSFCISARSEGNMYNEYRHSQGATPYFIFDDTKSSEQDKDGNFIEPEHLLVLFKYESPEGGNEYGDGYSITNANNPGDDEFRDFSEVKKHYPRLKGLKNIFQSVAADSKEKVEYEIEKKYNKELNSIERKYIEQDEDFLENNYTFSGIAFANKKINDVLSNKSQLYRFTATLKPTANEDDYIGRKISEYKYGNPEKSYKDFVEEVISFMYNGSENPKDSIKDWDITYKKQEFSDKNYKSYLEEVKQLVDKYRNELNKLRILKEQIDLLTKKQKNTLWGRVYETSNIIN